MANEIQCSPEHPCAAVQLLTQQINQESGRVDKVEKLIESLQNRLPLWATMAFAAAGTTIGILAGHAKF